MIRAIVDEILYYTRCFGVFHRARERIFGRANSVRKMVCTRCGSMWDERE